MIAAAREVTVQDAEYRREGVKDGAKARCRSPHGRKLLGQGQAQRLSPT